MEEYKRYLGDAVYVKFDGYHIILTTEYRIRATNIIALEPSVFTALIDYKNKLEAIKKAAQ